VKNDKLGHGTKNVPVAPDREPRLGASPVRRRQLAAAAAAEPHQPPAQPLGQLAVPVPVPVRQVADPAPGPLQLLIGCSAPVGNVDHDVLRHRLPVRRHRPFPAAAGPGGLSGGDHHHYHGRLTSILRRPGRPGLGLFPWPALASAGILVFGGND